MVEESGIQAIESKYAECIYSIQLLAKIEKLQGKTHTKFRITVIKKLLASTVPPQQVQSLASVTEFARFTGRHFPDHVMVNK